MDLDLAYQEGAVPDHLGSATLRIEQVARLLVTSGLVYAGDALITPRGSTFSQRVPTGSYPVLRRLRPLRWYEYGEAVGMGAVVALGVAGLVAGAGFLANILPTGQFEQLVSAGTVPLFSIAIGIEVASGIVVLLAGFLEHDLAIARKRRSE